MSLFTENDLRLLEKTLSIRERLVDNLIKNELPTKARDIDSFTNLLESIDRSILGRAKIKVENDATKANEETKEILKNLLLELHSNSAQYSSAEKQNVSAEEAPQYKPLNNIHIKEGELIPSVDNVDTKKLLEDHK